MLQVLKTNIILLLLLLFSLNLIGQTRVSFSINIDKNLTSEIMQICSQTNGKIGFSYNSKIISLEIGGQYQLYGNKNKNMPSFALTSHLLGPYLEVCFIKAKRVSPFIGNYSLNEVDTNYKNSYLDYSLNPTPSYFYTIENNSNSSHSYIPGNGYYAYYYNSIPLVSALYFGADIKIVQGLKIRVAIVNEYRFMKYREFEWKSHSDVSDYTFQNPNIATIEKQPLLKKRDIFISLNIGIKYDFYLEKRKQTKPNSTL
jgi:hypothetical protein